MNYKMMVLDLDGTLLNSRSQLTGQTKKALQQAMDRGIKIALCSSRSYEEMRTIIEELYEGRKGQGCIGFGGVCSYDTDGGVLAKDKKIEAEVSECIICLADEEGIHIQGYDEDTLYIYRNTKEFQAFVSYADVAQAPVKQVSYEEFKRLSYLKLMCLGERSRLEVCKNKIVDSAYTAFSNPAGQQGYLDILQKHASKGRGVSLLCQQFGISLEECICVGDGENDIPMILKAGLGIAMKNAEDNVKLSADMVLPYTNDEEAIVFIVGKYLQ